MNYELIAFDMDGTLLDSKKQVLPSSVEAIAQATSVGKSVAICSGRCPIMVAHHHDDMPSVRYAICSSRRYASTPASSTRSSKSNVSAWRGVPVPVPSSRNTPGRHRW